MPRHFNDKRIDLGAILEIAKREGQALGEALAEYAAPIASVSPSPSMSAA